MAGLCKRKSPWFNVLLFPVSMHLLFLFTYNHLVTRVESQRNQGLEKWIFKQLLPHCFLNSWPKEFSMRHESQVGTWDCSMQTAGYKRQRIPSKIKTLSKDLPHHFHEVFPLERISFRTLKCFAHTSVVIFTS